MEACPCPRIYSQRGEGKGFIHGSKRPYQTPMAPTRRLYLTRRRGAARRGERLLVRTGILFPRPSFAEGAGRIFDFANALSIYNYSRSPGKADLKAIWSDWQAVGDDLGSALSQAPEGAGEPI